MKEIAPTEAMSEDRAREYFIDIILGLEYCKLHVYVRTYIYMCFGAGVITFRKL